jgi:hypothetical protein
MRNIEPTVWLNFPNDVNHNTHYVNGWFQGEEHCTVRGISADLFDTISFIRKSPSQKKKVEIIHAIGYRSLEKQTIIITLKKRKQTLS